MRKIPLPAIICVILFAGLVACLTWSAFHLPARVASHFDARGNPNGWSDLKSFLQFMAILGLAFPVVVPAICYGSRFLPDELQNLPNRDHWLAPERRQETMSYVFRHSLWFAALALSFVLGIQLLVIYANTSTPARIPRAGIIGLTSLFVSGVIAWVVSLFMHFYRISPSHRTTVSGS
ncbi:MAG: DUF1648 domain-containing protein [Nibricoccus sp.]